MRANDPIDLLARECQDDQCRASCAPAQRERRLPRRPLIPRHLSFEGAQVEQPGLDLDDQQRPAPPVESKEIDPAMRSTLDDLDLTNCHPALGSKVAIGIGRTSGMDHISNVWTPWEDRWSDVESKVETERFADALDERDRGVRFPSLDPSDIARRDPNALRQLLPADVEVKASREASTCKGGSDRTRPGCMHWFHKRSGSDSAHRPVIDRSPVLTVSTWQRVSVDLCGIQQRSSNPTIDDARPCGNRD
jgi:hypothetical protein